MEYQRKRTNNFIEYQDVAIAYLTGGVSGMVRLCITQSVSPEMVLRAWEVLHSEGYGGEELSIALVYMLSPTVVREQPLA